MVGPLALDLVSFGKDIRDQLAVKVPCIVVAGGQAGVGQELLEWRYLVRAYERASHIKDDQVVAVAGVV
jgi:hypothetical protein